MFNYMPVIRLALLGIEHWAAKRYRPPGRHRARRHRTRRIEMRNVYMQAYAL